MSKKRKTEEENIKIYKIKSMAETMQNENKGPVPSDVLGSYTGMTADNTKPVQDADDL